MTWPTTPIPTANLDQQSDNPGLARADLLQMAQQVNTIQDTFTINSPQNGDFLVYSTTTSSFENKTQVSQLGHLPRMAIISWNVGTSTNSHPSGGFHYRMTAVETLDPDNIVTITGEGGFTIQAGTYLFLNNGYRIGGGTGNDFIMKSSKWYVGAIDNVNLIKDLGRQAVGLVQNDPTALSPDYTLLRTVAATETHNWYTTEIASNTQYYAPLMIIRLS